MTHPVHSTDPDPRSLDNDFHPPLGQTPASPTRGGHTLSHVLIAIRVDSWTRFGRWNVRRDYPILCELLLGAIATCLPSSQPLLPAARFSNPTHLNRETGRVVCFGFLRCNRSSRTSHSYSPPWRTIPTEVSAASHMFPYRNSHRARFTMEEQR